MKKEIQTYFRFRLSTYDISLGSQHQNPFDLFLVNSLSNRFLVQRCLLLRIQYLCVRVGAVNQMYGHFQIFLLLALELVNPAIRAEVLVFVCLSWAKKSLYWNQSLWRWSYIDNWFGELKLLIHIHIRNVWFSTN